MLTIILRPVVFLSLMFALVYGHAQNSTLYEDSIVSQITAEKLQFEDISNTCARVPEGFFQVRIAGMLFHIPTRYSISPTSGDAISLMSSLTLSSQQYLTGSMLIFRFADSESLANDLEEGWGVYENDGRFLDYPRGLKMIEIAEDDGSGEQVLLWMGEFLVSIHDYSEFALLFAESAREPCR